MYARTHDSIRRRGECFCFIFFVFRIVFVYFHFFFFIFHRVYDVCGFRLVVPAVRKRGAQRSYKLTSEFRGAIVGRGGRDQTRAAAAAAAASRAYYRSSD